MNKYTKVITISAILMSFIVIMPSFASADLTNGTDDAIDSVASVSNGSDDIASTASITNGADDVVNSTASITNGTDDVASNSRATLSNGTDDVASNHGATLINGTDDVASNSGAQLMNGGDDVNQNPTIPSTPAVTPASTGGSSGGSTGSHSGGRSTWNPIVTPAGTPCSYISEYMIFGGNNNSAEVSKLQMFLKNSEKINVDVNGNFDNKTLEAVRAFQIKYANDILKPWGVSTPTGQVFLTTKNKINSIVCKTPLALTADQNTQVESYKKNVSTGTVKVDANKPASSTPTPEVGSNDNTQTQTAAVGSTSVGSKIWGFVKWLFGY